MYKKKIVCFGGGSAIPKVILEELKKYDVDIVSVTSMVDDGGSTGKLRTELNILPPGDIRRHILALSDAPKWKKDLWGLRFENDGDLSGHNFGNIFMAGLEKSLVNYEKVIEKTCEFMEVKDSFRVMPATLEKVTLCAKMKDGSIIEGESEIDIPKKHDSSLKVDKVFLKKNAEAYKKLLPEIKSADAIIIGPGDLYSSVTACFLPIGISEAIKKSKAKKIFICNIFNKKGETNNFKVGDFAEEIEKYIDAELDYVLFNNKTIDKELLKSTKKDDCSILDQVVLEDEKRSEKKFLGSNFLKAGTSLHNSKKIVSKIWELI